MARSVFYYHHARLHSIDKYVVEKDEISATMSTKVTTDTIELLMKCVIKAISLITKLFIKL